MAELDIEALLAPLDAAAPCGADLEYEEAFRALEEALRGKPDQQYGDTVIPAEASDWRRVQALAPQLWARTRDLRVAVAWLRARLHLEGLQAAVDGLALITGLLERHWAHVHPMLDVEDGNDPTMRLNALLPLVDPAALLADLRSAMPAGPRGVSSVTDLPITGRLFELVAGRATPRADETVLAPDGLTQALRKLEGRQPGCVAALAGLADGVGALGAVLDREVGTAGPDLKPLQQFARLVSNAAREAVGAVESFADPAAAEPGEGGVDTRPADAPSAPGRDGAIRSREDAIRSLERTCDWIERHEPASPAPLLIRRAVRLMGMNFLDIVRELMPDGLGTIERLAGPADP